MPEAPQQPPGPVHLRLRGEPLQHLQALAHGVGLGFGPWSKRVTENELPAAIEEFVQDEAAREGTSVVIGPPDVPGTVMASQTKGLEFDAVLIVAPMRILTDGPRGAAELYVALTRATQRLGILHHGPLPQALTGLAETGTPTHAGNQRLA